MIVHKRVMPCKGGWLLIGAVVLANLPDCDFLFGLMLGDPRLFHHQATHSLTAALAVGLLLGCLMSRWRLNGILWGIWGTGLYLSHVVFDILVNDPTPPFGIQLLWPFSEAYFISPIIPFARFDYFDPAKGMVRTLLSIHNLGTVLREILLMVPFVGLAWYFSNCHNRSH
jgi:membrane-bound metal-dependent hydrolase YbcI (DUF457 family)